MRIAQVAPLYERVPPRWYGGTERVVSFLTEELVRQGHDVTLFASGDSRTRARLISASPGALRLDPSCVEPLPHHVALLEMVTRNLHRFDLVHFHTDCLHFPLASRAPVPTLTTLHGRLDLPDLRPLFSLFPGLPMVSISEAQREPLRWINWAATVHHGLPPDLYRLEPGPGRYLAVVGRVSPEKRVDLAIEIATRVGVPIRIAAKVQPVDRPYFEQAVRPLLSRPGVEFIGEIGEQEKQDLLGGALALLFPIDWPEPFGLVMIEALACGTPVIAFRRGSVPEILEHGVTGFIVNGLEDAVRAVEQAGRLSRPGCRQAFERRFTAERMARDYLETYARLVDAYPAAPAVRRWDGSVGTPEPVA